MKPRLGILWRAPDSFLRVRVREPLGECSYPLALTDWELTRMCDRAERLEAKKRKVKR